ncbi:GNAT family N-acetyltransferase [Winogradskya humida]|uniref:GNAT family N-acetyltransferase n=1 Tax=Winogradskya humida TaxID=113566 RepID=A0ABQ3ZT40_9ACTN|nr:GNAT family protein [Actinoplanes humidus]GIE21754.1 GNAT family N-acetyltransferase [Actinoplanes humidus]
MPEIPPPALLRGAQVTLRPATQSDVPSLAAIRATPEVRARWRGDDDTAPEIHAAIEDAGLQLLTILLGDRVVGAIQWSAEEDPEYRHASIDIFVDPGVHGRGVGTDAVRALTAYLTEVEGFHRLVIDPAADNAAAIRCYTKVGFRPIGIMRQYERSADGTWHDGLLMDLLATEFVSLPPEGHSPV